MEYVFVGVMFVCIAWGVVGIVMMFRSSGRIVPAPTVDLAATVELLLDVANYLSADASKGGRDYRYKCEIEAKRLQEGK